MNKLFLLLSLVATAGAATNDTNERRRIHLKAAAVGRRLLRVNTTNQKIEGGFLLDLLGELRSIANRSKYDVDLSFEVADLRDRRPRLNKAEDLLDKDCTTNQGVQNKTDCGRYDFVLNPVIPTSDTHDRVPMSPGFLQEWVAAARYENGGDDNTPYFSTFAELEKADNGTLCLSTSSQYYKSIKGLYPNLSFFDCGQGRFNCFVPALKNGTCQLWAALRSDIGANAIKDPSLVLTQEAIFRNYMVWPMRHDMDPAIKHLFESFVYDAVLEGTADRLYNKHYLPKVCPLGFAGETCQDYCHAEHGKSDRLGRCICHSTRYTGSDCALEVEEDTGMIPFYQLVLGYAMFAINLATVVLCGLWLFQNKGRPHVAMAQPFFLGLVLLGCAVSSSTILALMQQADSGENPVQHCMLIPWLYSLGFSITFGTLFTKIYRVHKLVRNANRMRRKKISILSALRWIAVVLCVDMAILIAWQVEDPLDWTRTITSTDKFGTPLASVGTCSSEKLEWFLGFLVGWHFLLVLGASYMCYTTRKVPNSLSGSKGVSIAMVSNFQIFLVGVPVLVLIGSDPQSSFFLRSAIVWINDLVVVLAVFGELIFGSGLAPSMTSITLSAKTGQRKSSSRLQSHLSKWFPPQEEQQQQQSATANMPQLARPEDEEGSDQEIGQIKKDVDRENTRLRFSTDPESAETSKSFQVAGLAETT